MHLSFDLHSPPMTLAIALLAGMVGQSLAYHLRYPGIVVLLLMGALLGPDGLKVVEPSALGDGLRILAGFAITMILFEAGMNFDVRELRREAPAVQRLVTIGVIVTFLGAGIAAAPLLLRGTRTPFLFGALVVTTGAAVISPLLRRIRVRRNLQTILEGEGVFIDGMGAILGVVALHVAFIGHDGAPSPLTGLVAGALTGITGGCVMLLLLRWRRLVPSGMEKVFTLMLAWATFQISNAFSADSGALAVIVAGMIATNLAPETTRVVREHKEPLTGMMLGAFFVLLAAQVRVAEALTPGWRGLVVVAGLMVFVRPLSVFLSTVRTGLSVRERAFLSWIGPRGVVAVALAALFHDALGARGIEDVDLVRDLVLLVVIGTVLIQGLTGSMVAGWLGVKRPRGQGYVILGGNPLAVEVARALKQGGEESVLIDANPSLCSEVEAKGFRVLHGNALDERIMQRAEIDTRKAIISLLPNDGVNLLFARRAVDEYRADRVYVAMHGGAIRPAHVSEIRGRVLFGSAADVDQWASRLGRGEALVERWLFAGVPDSKSNPTMPIPKEQRTAVLPITLARGTTVRPVDDRYEPKKGDVVTWTLATRREEDARAWLRGRGWSEEGAA